ncbi:MAG: hypothetical protein SPL78_05505 [Bacteroidales bacterium]|nr:hypothetical protein [Bacteroidales bacterium]
MSSPLDVMKASLTSAGDSIHVTDRPGNNAQLLPTMLESVSLCLKGARGRQPVGWMQWHTAPTPLSASESLWQVSENISKHRSERRWQVCERVPWGVAD